MLRTVREALAAATERLSGAGVDDAGREAVWLLAHVMDTSAGTVRLNRERELAPELRAQFEALVGRRERREPIQYILGTAEFLGLTIGVTPAVLIPRLDTETLVLEAVRRLSTSPLVADIGTGSGAVAVGVATLVPGARVVAVDISADALAVARANAAANGVADRVEFRHGDLVAPLQGDLYDAILSNPPYIGQAEMLQLMPEVREYEPHLALTPGDDSLLYYRRLAAEAPAYLKPGGFLAVEVGIEQGAAVSQLFRAAGLVVDTYRDTAGVQRVVAGRRVR